MVLFPLVWAFWACVAQGSLASPKRSNATTPVTKLNATIPVAAHQNHKTRARTNHSDAPDPLGETRVGCRTPICVGEVDTLVLIDVSGGIGERGLQKVKDMLQKFPHHFDMNQMEAQGQSATQFLALMAYDEYPKIQTQWTDNVDHFKSKAMDMELGWSAGDLGNALAQSTQLLRYARDHSLHNVLVITDGGTPGRLKANQMAERLGQSGAALFAVVVEDYVGDAHDEMFEIIQSTGQMPANDYMMSVNNYDALDTDDAIGQMVYMLCPQIMQLMSVGSKVERKLFAGNRTALTQSKKSPRNFRKAPVGALKH